MGTGDEGPRRYNFQHVSSTFLKAVLGTLDRLVPASDGRPKHLITGARGEDIAYFHLREQGYTIVARNWRVAGAKGELDLVGWEAKTLCFIEVKTRTTRYVKPAEAAVDEEKRRHLRQMARRYMRRMKGRADGSSPKCRFDIVSLYLTPTGEAEELTLFRDAFPLA
jgi:putative endonuclease